LEAKEHLFGFEKLNVWQESRQLNYHIYKTTSGFPDCEKFGIVTQMRRAVISVCSNIAEGSSRKSAKDQAHFYHLAYSSLMELLCQCIISEDLNFITEQQLMDCRNQIRKVATMINALRKTCMKRINH
jgi:four helix bundle protein